MARRAVSPRRPPRATPPPAPPAPARRIPPLPPAPPRRRKGLAETIEQDHEEFAEYAVLGVPDPAAAPGSPPAAPTPGLAPSLTAWDIVAYGIGSTVGAGLFVVTGRAAKDFAGPGVTVSFVLAGVSCLFSALCYAELASAVPVSGSAYSYTYITLGEAAAWFIGWNLTLEYGVSASAVARGWASYCDSFFASVGAPLPAWLHGFELWPGTLLASASPLAALICLACTAVLLMGAKESSRLNLAVTAVNLVVIAFIAVVGGARVDPANWEPFAPNGLSGVLSGASFVFFSYIGFDAVCTLGEECRDPQRDMPVGILGSLGVVSLLYVVVSLVLTGMVPVPEIDPFAPLARAFEGAGLPWAARAVALGSVTILTATTFCSLFGQPRIFLAMSRDGLLPAALGRIHPRTRVPGFGTLFAGGLSAALALLLDIDTLTDVISVGTLAAFVVVCVAVLHLRYCSAAESLAGGPSPPPSPPGAGPAAGPRGGPPPGPLSDALRPLEIDREGSSRGPPPGAAGVPAPGPAAPPPPDAAPWVHRAARALSPGQWVGLFVLASFVSNAFLQSVVQDVVDWEEGEPGDGALGALQVALMVPVAAALVAPVMALRAVGGSGGHVFRGRGGGGAGGPGAGGRARSPPAGGAGGAPRSQGSSEGGLLHRGRTPRSRSRDEEEGAREGAGEGEGARLVASAGGVLSDGTAVGAPPAPRRGEPFRAPWVPLVPCLGIWVNCHLITGLRATALARMAAWTAVGLGVYFLYGMPRSRLRHRGVRRSR